MFHPSLLVSIGNTEMFDKFSASMWLSWLGSRVGRILEYICIIINVTEKAGKFPTQWVATWLGRESIQFDHWSWNIELFSSVLLFSILLASLSLQFSTELSLWVHLIICRASSHSWRQYFTLALECFTLQLVVVVYLFVYLMCTPWCTWWCTPSCTWWYTWWWTPWWTWWCTTRCTWWCTWCTWWCTPQNSWAH